MGEDAKTLEIIDKNEKEFIEKLEENAENVEIFYINNKKSSLLDEESCLNEKIGSICSKSLQIEKLNTIKNFGQLIEDLERLELVDPLEIAKLSDLKAKIIKNVFKQRIKQQTLDSYLKVLKK